MQNKDLEFIDNSATFRLESPDFYSYLYFPLANEAGMMESITPLLAGDIKTSQNTFLTTPVSAEELHTSRSTLNFWIYKDGKGAWSATGESAKQISERSNGDETSTLEAGFLFHKMTRKNSSFGLESKIVTFVPCVNDTVSLSKITIKNTSNDNATITPTLAVPIYGRSADNFRSHRHVTSLLNRVKADEFGITLKPTMLFDETGHKLNNNTYSVYGADSSENPPIGFFTDVESFIGEGGTLDWPQAVYLNKPARKKEDSSCDGYEAMGGLRFRTVTLKPNEEIVFVIALGINCENIKEKYLSIENFDRLLEENKSYWLNKLNINIKTANKSFDLWMKWVSCEPILRRIFGCSFLPHHDYGRGGRGWRDLFQDCISLLFMEPEKVSEMLYQNCAGIRFDGTNATIIGSKPGEFIADRNNIARVWMDHAAWPLNTISFYINQTGDLDFLLKEQTYFKDKLVNRCRSTDESFTADSSTKLLCENCCEYRGSIIEHLLIENLTACLNVGNHGMLRLLNADWNDALDMAYENGESVAFTSMYYGNLKILSSLLIKLSEQLSIKTLTMASEFAILLNGIKNTKTREEMQECLTSFSNLSIDKISGKKIAFGIDDLVFALDKLSSKMAKLINETQVVETKSGNKFINGYYDNDSNKVEGEKDGKVFMTLTGQVFPIMFSVCDDNLTKEIIKSADKYLFSKDVGGYRLNTDFKSIRMNLGRQFGFAYGSKENGAVFSHMAIMYANALYKRGFAKEGFKVLDTLCSHCMDFNKSKIYPGIPEYINSRGRGMYHYLTGAASWLILTFITEVFGIKGDCGDLIFKPKLLLCQFDKSGIASCQTKFANRDFLVTYFNPQKLDFGEYYISNLKIDGNEICKTGTSFKIKLEDIEKLNSNSIHKINLTLKEIEK